MKIIVNFLLLSSFSIWIAASNPHQILQDVRETVEEKNINSPDVKFYENGFLGKSNFSVVWKGDYKGQIVAYKLTANENVYAREVQGFAALDALQNAAVEKYGIPNVYVHGPGIKPPYWTIAMTLLDENLNERWIKQKKNISELSILLIFKRGVQILQYLKKKKIVHNDIKPANIFLRGSEVFLGDFNLSSKNDENKNNRGGTMTFASSRLYSNEVRTYMDDLESLVFSLWYVAGIEWDKANLISKERIPEGKTLARCKRNGTAKSKMTEKCKKFKNKHVQKAFHLIAAEEMLKGTDAPDYKLIVKILDEAIRKVHEGKPGPPKFEWLTGASSSSQSNIVRNIPDMGENDQSSEWSVIVS